MISRLSPRRRQGFSLVELAVVIVIVGVLAAFGVPRYRDSVERTKCAEAFNYLSAVRAAQERHQALKGKYATNVEDLDIQQEAPKYFNFENGLTYPEVIQVTNDGAGNPAWFMVLERDSDSSSYGGYNVVFTHQGLNNAAGFAPVSNIPVAINPVAD